MNKLAIMFPADYNPHKTPWLCSKINGAFTLNQYTLYVTVSHLDFDSREGT